MARKIELSFYDKKYIIEYNRASVKEVLNHQKDDVVDQVIVLIKAGLQLHHKDDMPSDDEVLGWVLALGDDLQDFAEALKDLVQGVLDTFKKDRKNLKWGKVEA